MSSTNVKDSNQVKDPAHSSELVITQEIGIKYHHEPQKRIFESNIDVVVG